jgi:hypothetical protein
MIGPTNNSRNLFEVRRGPLAPERDELSHFNLRKSKTFTLKTLNPNTETGFSKLAHTQRIETAQVQGKLEMPDPKIDPSCPFLNF